MVLTETIRHMVNDARLDLRPLARKMLIPLASRESVRRAERIFASGDVDAFFDALSACLVNKQTPEIMTPLLTGGVRWCFTQFLHRFRELELACEKAGEDTELLNVLPIGKLYALLEAQQRNLST